MPSTSPPFEARLYDGLSAQPRQVSIAAEPLGLVVSTAGISDAVAWDRLRRGGSSNGHTTLHRTDAPDWRLLVPIDTPWAAALPALGSWTRRQQLAAGAATLVALAGFGWLALAGDALIGGAARLIPHSVTAPIGAQLVAGMGQPCTGDTGRRALRQLATTLAPAGDIREPLTITVIDDATVNAAALPGGQVVIFRGLIEKAGSSGEVAGVLAHELGHVARAHVNKGLIRQLGLSLLTGGSDVAGFVNLALLLRATRADEAEADGEALRRMRRAGWSAAPLADFFDRERRKRGGDDLLGGLGDYAATHPPDAERAARFRAAGAGRRNVLSAADWQGLRGICKG